MERRLLLFFMAIILLPPRPQTGSLPPAAGNRVLPATPSACRVPRFSGSAHRWQPPVVPAMRNWRPDADAHIPTVSRPCFPPGQLMTPPCWNPQPRQRCLSGRARSTYAPHDTQSAERPFPRRSSSSSSLHLPIPRRHRLAKHPATGSESTSHLSRRQNSRTCKRTKPI
jgi:hypothetical protein